MIIISTIIAIGVLIPILLWFLGSVYRVLSLYLLLLPIEIYISTSLRITSSQVLQILLLLFWGISAIYSLKMNSWNLSLRNFHILCFLLQIYLIASIAWSIDYISSIKSLYRMTISISISIVIVSVTKNRQHIDYLLSCLCVGAILTSIYGLYQYYQGSYGSIHHFFSPFYQDVFKTRGSGISIVGTFSNPNTLASFLGPIIPIIVSKSISSKTIHSSIFWIVSSLIVILTVILTYSKNGWLQVATSLILITLLTTKARTKVVLFILFTPIMIYILLMGRGIFEQIFPRDYEISISPRIELWKIALLIFITRPWTGYGLDGFNKASEQLRFGLLSDLTKTHNMYLQMLVDIGIIGFCLLYGIFVYTTINSIYSLKKNLPKRDKYTNIGLISSIIVIIVGGMFDTMSHSNAYISLIWIIVGLSIALSYQDIRSYPKQRK